MVNIGNREVSSPRLASGRTALVATLQSLGETHTTQSRKDTETEWKDVVVVAIVTKDCVGVDWGIDCSRALKQRFRSCKPP